jgi:hypothetical protein
VQVDLRQTTTIVGIGLDEPDVWPRMQQKYTHEVKDGETWKALISGSTNGHGIRKSIPPTYAKSVCASLETPAGSPGVAE